MAAYMANSSRISGHPNLSRGGTQNNLIHQNGTGKHLPRRSLTFDFADEYNQGEYSLDTALRSHSVLSSVSRERVIPHSHSNNEFATTNSLGLTSQHKYADHSHGYDSRGAYCLIRRRGRRRIKSFIRSNSFYPMTKANLGSRLNSIPEANQQALEATVNLPQKLDMEDIDVGLNLVNDDQTVIEDILETEPKVRLQFDDDKLSLNNFASSNRTLVLSNSQHSNGIWPPYSARKSCTNCGSSHCLMVLKTPGYYLPEHVSQHNKADDCWIVAHGVVYDATRYLPRHPGGPRAILLRGGQDATKDFDFHTKHGKKLWERYSIGRLAYCDGGKTHKLKKLDDACTIS